MLMIRFFLLLLLLAAPHTAIAQGTVSSADPRATRAGMEMLRQGGSATDAAMAMMLALTVVEPQSSGIGGGGFLLHHDGQRGLVETIDGREMAPASATPSLFLTSKGQPMGFMQAVPGGKSVGVPGNVALMKMAHDKWGKLPWAALFGPAIELARDGFTVSKPLAGRLELLASIWKDDFPEARALYWIEGKPAPEGATIRNPALAAFLEKLALEGPDAFYQGDNARAISSAVAGARRNATQLTEEDLSGYRAKQRPAVCSPYRS